MSRVKDLWWTTGKRGPRRKTARHPDNGGDKNAARWLAVWNDPSGREVTKAFTNKEKAKQHGNDQEADVSRGEYLDPDAGKVLVEPIARKYLRLREVGASSATRYESCYRIHIAPTFGEREAGSVRVSEVAEWSKGMADHPVTRHLALTIFCGIMDLAVADKIRRDNPVRSPIVGRPKPKQERKADPWPAERILAVADACGQYRAVPLTAAGLGLRQGMVFALADEDFGFADEVVHIRRQIARHEGGWVFKLPKGGKTWDVPLPRGVAALVKLAESAEITPVSLPWLDEDGKLGKPVTVNLIFRWADGRHFTGLAWDRKVWKPALVKAGVIPPYEGDYVLAREHGMHALRHWYSTRLLDNGVSLAAVMEFMGHSRKRAPLAIGVYGHVTPEALERARQAVDSGLFGLRSVASDGTVTELRAAR